MRPWLLLTAVLFPGVAAAGHDVSLGVTAVTLTNGGVYNVTTPRLGLDATYAYELGSWRLGGGLRWAPSGRGNLPVEVYARALLTPQLGRWRPAVGPELGVSGLPVILPPEGGFPDDLMRRQASQLGPAYVAVHAAPLRFDFRPFTVSALELQWGTTLNQPGATLRLQFGLVHLGVTL
ncbi:hypothetical protein ATI61_106349 [Archangium gephyra]|uniref:Outer membrane protein beta-barrel domain-containing protein n=1 Tax=Archangium gephyra TaxID=48 RepID=A0AAC8Q188_9BACT|nr:hypothetical protein [Archangium gephyra]AKI98970.1 Hypothetical protein AA314_00597 [Archangium gephyra]REG30879.1 hypothetical protein ATI61_106349 [Archangium gephyra]